MNLLIEKISNRIKQYLVGLELANFKKNEDYFDKKIGLEIGGPSGIFSSNQILPVYKLAKQVDGVNFSTQTIWENTIQPGLTYKYELNKVGYQYILEASDLSSVADNQYDFLLSSHSLEHCANPLKALMEWKRVVRIGGVILIAVPDKRATFDHKRPTTTFEHVLKDYELNTQEDDLTHFDEIMTLHDISRDAGVNSKEQFRDRSLKNYENRCLHHHIFDSNLLQQLFNYIDMKIIFTDSFLPSLILVAEKK